MSRFWTEERVEKVRGFLAEGLSAAQVGQKIGATRNAVIGIAFRKRLGMNAPGLHAGRPAAPAAPKAANPSRSVGKINTAAPVAPTARLLATPVEVALEFDKKLWRSPQWPVRRAAFMRAGDCRYPFGDPRDADFGFCGEARREGSSYCAGHHRLCHTPSRRQEAEAAARVAA